MASNKEYTLTKKGSVAYRRDGRLHRHRKGDTITAAQYRKLSKRHKKYFEAVDNEAEEAEDTGPEDMTVDELKEYFDENEVEYDSKAKKADLVQLYNSVH